MENREASIHRDRGSIERKRRVVVAVVALTIQTFLHAPSPPTQTLHLRHMGDTFIAMLDNAVDQCWNDLFRMRKSCFVALRTWLLTHTTLGQPRRGDTTSAHEKLIIFMYIICQGATIRHTALIFGRALGSIHRLAFCIIVGLFLTHQ